MNLKQGSPEAKIKKRLGERRFEAGREEDTTCILERTGVETLRALDFEDENLEPG